MSVSQQLADAALTTLTALADPVRWQLEQALAGHARVLGAVLDILHVRDARLVAQDWGGPIGLRVMMDTRRITSLVLRTTWAWPVNGVPPLPVFPRYNPASCD